MLDKGSLEAIAHRCSHATPGPWMACTGYEDFDYESGGVLVHESHPYNAIRVAGSDGAAFGANSHEVGQAFHDFNAEFVAHAHEDILALLAEVERLTRAHTEAAVVFRDLLDHRIADGRCTECWRPPSDHKAGCDTEAAEAWLREFGLAGGDECS